MKKLTVKQYNDLFGWGYESDYGKDRYSSGLLDYFNDLIEWRDTSNDPSPVVIPGVMRYIPIDLTLSTPYKGAVRGGNQMFWHSLNKFK